MNDVTDSGILPPMLDAASMSREWLEGGMALLDTTGRVVEVNAPLADWLGIPVKQLIGQGWYELLRLRFPDWDPPLKEAQDTSQVFTQQVLSVTTVKPVQWFRLELAHHQSGYFLRLNSILPPRAELAETGWNQQLCSDTAVRDMYVRLMKAESKLDNLVHRWPGVIFSQRADFTFQFVSPNIESLTGITVDKWLRPPQHFWEVVHEADVEEVKQQMRRAMTASSGVSCTYRIRQTQTGQVTYVLEHRQAILSQNGLLLGYEGMWLDVTRQTIAERRLSTAAWKETLGLVTMGLAHDFSNIMAGIHALSESFLSQVDTTHPFQEGLNLIKQHSLQASQLVHRIIQLHHGKTGERNYRDLNEIVDDVVDLTRKILPRRIQINVNLAPTALPLYVDAVECCQVILNLVLNAVDAMPRGGKLLLQTSLHEHIPTVACLQGTLPRLPSACLTVEDTGCGIPARHLAAVFDPFFTTKPMNKGSGLGLYNARLFAEKHQGAIGVDSTEGVGTTFRLLLPQADFSEAERVVCAANEHRCCMVLLGQPSEVLNSTTEFLRLQGCHVVVAHNRDQVLRLLESAEYPFAGLFILAEAAAQHLTALVPEIRRRWPALKIIIQIVGCNQDELDNHLLSRADLILEPGLKEEDVANQLKRVLAVKPPPES